MVETNLTPSAAATQAAPLIEIRGVDRSLDRKSTRLNSSH